jgi:hypothetical protein
MDKIGDYIVEVFKADYPVISANSNPYDLVYLEDTGHIWPTIIGLKIYDDTGSLFKSAIIGAHGGGSGIHETSHILKSDRIVICCSDTVFCLSIPDLYLLWKTKCDMATCFGIFNYKEDYIIHGEVEITRLSNNGKIIWQQSGADIFTTLNSGKEDFLITDDHILATDWDSRKYKFDFDGNPIN